MDYTQVRVTKEIRKEIRMLSVKLGIDVPTTIELLLRQFKTKEHI